MSLLLFILFFLPLLVVLVRGWLFFRGIRKKVNDTFGGASGERRERTYRRETEEYTETGERKKYSSNEGEYADFEEVSGTVIEETVTTSVIEEQITDAEYEEV